MLTTECETKMLDSFNLGQQNNDSSYPLAKVLTGSKYKQIAEKMGLCDGGRHLGWPYYNEDGQPEYLMYDNPGSFDFNEGLCLCYNTVNNTIQLYSE